jgi:hypothetical protein
MKRLSIDPVGAPAVEPRSTGFGHVLTLLISTFREIFDEAAYQRFLNRRQITSSREAYAAFCRECEAAMVCRPRCC